MSNDTEALRAARARREAREVRGGAPNATPRTLGEVTSLPDEVTLRRLLSLLTPALAEHVKRTVDAAPPTTAAQREKIAAHLRPSAPAGAVVALDPIAELRAARESL